MTAGELGCDGVLGDLLVEESLDLDVGVERLAVDLGAGHGLDGLGERGGVLGGIAQPPVRPGVFVDAHGEHEQARAPLQHRSPGVDFELQRRGGEQPLTVVGDDLDLAGGAGVDGERLLHDHVATQRDGLAETRRGRVTLGRAVDAPEDLGADAAADIDEACG